MIPDHLLVKVQNTLCQSLDLDKTLFNTLKLLREWLPADGAYVNFFERDELALKFLGHATKAGPEPVLTKLSVSQEWREHVNYAFRPQYMIVDDIETQDPAAKFVFEALFPKIRSAILIRLVLDDIHYGVACFYAYGVKAFNGIHMNRIKQIENLLRLNVIASSAVYFRERDFKNHQENRRLTHELELARELPLKRLLKVTPSFEKLSPVIKRMAMYDTTVLITGESGTGKDVLANTIQQMSERRNGPFVTINCGTVSEQTIESELFGHERGAFAGANGRHVGLFEQANHGTLFLDEIAELPANAQVALLHVLQEHAFRRVGGTDEIRADVRVICSTNRDLEKMVKEKSFREDLFYRLNVLPLHIEPLRNRPEDIEPLCLAFLKETAREYGLPYVPRLTESALQAAKSQAWIGNVRELKNVITRAVLLGEPVIAKLDFKGNAKADMTLPETSEMKRRMQSFTAGCAFDDWQREYFKNLLSVCHGRISGAGGAAELSKINASTLRSRLKKLGIRLERSFVVD